MARWYSCILCAWTRLFSATERWPFLRASAPPLYPRHGAVEPVRWSDAEGELLWDADALRLEIVSECLGAVEPSQLWGLILQQDRAPGRERKDLSRFGAIPARPFPIVLSYAARHPFLGFRFAPPLAHLPDSTLCLATARRVCPQTMAPWPTAVPLPALPASPAAARSKASGSSDGLQAGF